MAKKKNANVVRWVQTAPQDWLDVVREQARRQGVTRAEWVRDAIREKLPERVAKKLSTPCPPGRP